jgi:hypothetical protein
MATELKRLEEADALAVKAAESDIANIVKSQEFENVRAGLDAAGLLDPSPVSDGASMVMSLAAGDWVDAGPSLISMVPYAGDALGKTAKGAKLAKRLAKLADQLAAATKKLEALNAAARKLERAKAAAAAAIKKRAENAAARFKCKTCTKPSNRFGSQLPATGKWKGEKGNSRWTSDDGSVSMDYKNGYPDFKTSEPKSVKDSVEIQMSGNDQKDFAAARKLMREKTGDKTWPGNGKVAPDGYTWHHTEDGVTMQLVSTKVHNKAESGAAHTGGASLTSDPAY